jgi:hypothetical protein
MDEICNGRSTLKLSLFPVSVHYNPPMKVKENLTKFSKTIIHCVTYGLNISYYTTTSTDVGDFEAHSKVQWLKWYFHPLLDLPTLFFYSGNTVCVTLWILCPCFLSTYLRCN